MEALIVLVILLSALLIILVGMQPRQTQIFSNDATSNIGKPSYWQSNRAIKLLTLVTSVVLFVLLLMFMIIGYS